MKKIIILITIMFSLISTSFYGNIINYSYSYNNTISYKKIDKVLDNFFFKIRKNKNTIKQKILIFEKIEKKIFLIKKKKKSSILDYIEKKVKEEKETYLEKREEEDINLEKSILDLLEEKIDIQGEKNRVYKNFSQGKRALEKIYKKKELKSIGVYSNCSFNPVTKKVINKGCLYKNDGRYKKRALKIEWEHIVPAENFGKSFKSWRTPEKFPICKKKKGSYSSSRTCAGKVSLEFRQMESDIYNLYPSIGALNALRRNYQIAEIPGEKRIFGNIDFEIENKKVEPPKEVKGDIARVYMYMNITYPGKDILGKNNKSKKLVEAWNKLDPIDKKECDRYRVLKRYQQNINIILEETCKTLR